jgi:twitching motility protein PilT
MNQEINSEFFKWLYANFNDLPKDWGDLILDNNKNACVINGNGDLEELTGSPIITKEDFEHVISLQTRKTARITLDDIFTTHDDEAEDLEKDFAAIINGFRFRCNLHLYNSGELGFVGRKINNDIRLLSTTGLPQDIMMEMFGAKSGIIAFVGATGAGKTSTLASCLNEKLDEPLHIVTLEDPIENLLPTNRIARVRQREIGPDTRSFYSGLRAALRQKPHIIVVAEIRDARTAEAAMKAAISGHLVLTTIHANTCSEAPRRIIDLFPPELQPAMRNMLADTFVGFVAQKLVKKIGGGRVLAYEIMNRNNDGVVVNIKKGDFDDLSNNIFSDHERTKMNLMEQSLANLFVKGIISEEEGLLNAPNKERFKNACNILKGVNNKSAPSFGKKL